jgi:hypothetical protein
MSRWHIIDDRQLLRFARLRRLQAMLLLALGVAAGTMLGRDDGPVAAAQAAGAPAAAVANASPQTAWCDHGGMRMSCALSSPSR